MKDNTPKPTAHRFCAKAPPLKFTPEGAKRFAATVFSLAERAVAFDAELWEKIEELADAGNAAEIARLARLRRTMAPEDILSSLRRGAA